MLDVLAVAADLGLSLVDATASPLPGPSGNVEYFLWLRRGEVDPMRPAEELVHAAVRRGPQ
jgi:23S rRNA (cytidine1920-2'-O)/16S rRNA (cytidine1409-2'-O)-methyltransferase